MISIGQVMSGVNSEIIINGVSKGVKIAVEKAPEIIEKAPQFINDVGEIVCAASKFKDLPTFSKNISLNSITNFSDADKPLYSNEKSYLNDNTDNNKSFESNKINDTNEEKEKIGGSYKEVFKEGQGEKYEVHHMPADNVNGLERNDGPAIRMDKEDHRETASCGNSIEAREYRAYQKELIDKGKFREALQMDIDDIRNKFGNKYDDAISQMLEYVDKLEAEGMI